MENEAHLICEEDFRLENFDDNKEIPAMAEFHSGYLSWTTVSRIAIVLNHIGVRYWNKRPTLKQRIETPWPDGDKYCDSKQYSITWKKEELSI